MKTHSLEELLKQRIVFMDGAMGTMIQKHKLEEEDFRGERFHDHESPLKGNNDLLTLTQAKIIRDIHLAYYRAGADMVETNTFSATTIGQADYHLESIAYELNLAGAKLAREAAQIVSKEENRPCWVAGSVGPTNRTASLSPDVNRPEFRNTSFDELVEAYAEQVNGLMEGAVDLILIETIFDTLNAKAAVFATEDVFKQRKKTLPIIISGTITDQSGRTLSGQTTEAFWNSLRHAKPLAIGMNCALGADLMRPYIEELSNIADTYISCYPNAGLPDPLSPTGYPEGPEDTADAVEHFAQNGFLNLIGGCCGTTPDHIAAIKKRLEKYPARKIPNIPATLRLSGLEPLNAASVMPASSI